MTLDDLASPAWWGTAIAGSIALKIVADYVRKGIDKALSQVSSRWSERTRAVAERTESHVQQLAENDDLREWFFQRELRFRSHANTCLLISIFPFILLLTMRVLGRVASLPEGAWPFHLATVSGAFAVYFLCAFGGLLTVMAGTWLMKANHVEYLLCRALQARNQDKQALEITQDKT
ncbi:hypothetical protein [Burkholderia gladioli]|uniref:hypothetical protein n=1 Tax=Burkholderia gladioli TaxID=28095 RepID=UPI00163F5104|nr:hypothetical protein [Burkholderia gladioli]